MGSVTNFTRYEGDNWTHNINNLNSFINTIYCTSEGDVWLGQSPLGAFRYSKGSWENYPPESGTGLEFVYTINEDAEGNIWIALEMVFQFCREVIGSLLVLTMA